MVRARSSLILVGLLLILLPVLAVMQYRWIGEVSTAERTRLESSLRIASERFAIDFDSEFARLANALQIRDGFPKNGDSIVDRYQAWSEVTGHPQLVSAIYALRITPTSEPEFYEVHWASRALQPATLPEHLQNLRDRLRPGSFSYGVGESIVVVTPILRSGRPFGGGRPDDFRSRPEQLRRQPDGRGRGIDRGPRPDRPDRTDGPGPALALDLALDLALVREGRLMAC